MGSRRRAVPEVRTGPADVIACPATAVWAAGLHGPDGRPVPLPGRTRGGAQHPAGGRAGMDSGSIELRGLGWFADDEPVRDAPAAQRQASVSHAAEQGGPWLACTPASGLVEGARVGCEVVVPLAWTGPAAMDPLHAARLDRLRTVRTLLAAPPPPAARTAAPGPAAAAAGRRPEGMCLR